MSDKVAWLLLACGVAILILGLSHYSTDPRATRFLPVLAAVLGGVVLVFAIVGLAD